MTLEQNDISKINVQAKIDALRLSTPGLALDIDDTISWTGKHWSAKASELAGIVDPELIRLEDIFADEALGGLYFLLE
jgi:hypothetical protein